MSAPYAKTVMTANGKRQAGNGPGRAGSGQSAGGPSPVLLATLGAACISASAVLIKLADTGTASAAFYRSVLALPVLTALAVLEQRRRRPARGLAGALPGPARALPGLPFAVAGHDRSGIRC